MASVDREGEEPIDEDKPFRPTIYFETITFSDGTTLKLGESDIVVFVGPNNAGKSAALRELEAWVAKSQAGVVLTHATTVRQGTQTDLRAYLEANSQKTGVNDSLSYGGIGYNIHHTSLKYFDVPRKQGAVASFFCEPTINGRSYNRLQCSAWYRFTSRAAYASDSPVTDGRRSYKGCKQQI